MPCPWYYCPWDMPTRSSSRPVLQMLAGDYLISIIMWHARCSKSCISVRLLGGWGGGGGLILSFLVVPVVPCIREKCMFGAFEFSLRTLHSSLYFRMCSLGPRSCHAHTQSIRSALSAWFKMMSKHLKSNLYEATWPKWLECQKIL